MHSISEHFTHTFYFFTFCTIFALSYVKLRGKLLFPFHFIKVTWLTTTDVNFVHLDEVVFDRFPSSFNNVLCGGKSLCVTHISTEEVSDNSLRIEYLPKLFGIPQNVRFVSSLPFIYYYTIYLSLCTRGYLFFTLCYNLTYFILLLKLL